VLEAQIFSLHRTDGCNARDTVEISLDGKALGAQMHFLALGLSAALRKQRALVFDEDRWLYGRHENCKGRGRRCFFLSLFPSGCSRDSILAASNSSISRTRGWEAELQSTKETHIDVITTARHLREGLLPPPAFSHLGLFWWRSSLLSILTRKSFYLESLLREAKASMGWPEEERRGILGVHVRRGDSCLHAAMSASRPLCMPTNLYLNAIATMVSKYEFTAIFLATDSKEAIEGMTRFARKRGLKLVYQRFDRDVFSNSFFIEHMVENGFLETQIVTESTLVDLFLLAECDALVGGFSSQLSRLALSLLATRVGKPPPFISVDGYSWGRHALEEMWEVSQELLH